MASPPGTCTVMIVDDSEVARILLRDILEEYGYGVVEAVDGVDAVEKYAAVRPDVTIMDVKMPRKDGIEATAEILALDEDARVLLCSSTDEETLRLAAATAGASGIVLKPFIHERVVAAIHGALAPREKQG